MKINRYDDSIFNTIDEQEVVSKRPTLGQLKSTLSDLQKAVTEADAALIKAERLEIRAERSGDSDSLDAAKETIAKIDAELAELNKRIDETKAAISELELEQLKSMAQAYPAIKAQLDTEMTENTRLRRTQLILAISLFSTGFWAMIATAILLFN